MSAKEVSDACPSQIGTIPDCNLSKSPYIIAHETIERSLCCASEWFDEGFQNDLFSLIDRLTLPCIARTIMQYNSAPHAELLYYVLEYLTTRRLPTPWVASPTDSENPIYRTTQHNELVEIFQSLIIGPTLYDTAFIRFITCYDEADQVIDFASINELYTYINSRYEYQHVHFWDCKIPQIVGRVMRNCTPISSSFTLHVQNIDTIETSFATTKRRRPNTTDLSASAKHTRDRRSKKMNRFDRKTLVSITRERPKYKHRSTTRYNQPRARSIRKT